jgi:RNA polymerase sigma-70 factor (ECF subfamily)
VEDADLIARVLVDGDPHAFGELVKQYQSVVRGLLRKWLVTDDAQADDLAQLTFVKAHQKLAQFNGQSSFSTWLCQIAYREFLSWRRSAKRHLSLDEAPDESGVQHGDSLIDLRHDLKRAMKFLNEDERLTIVCCCQQGMTHEEASSVLDLPLGTVKTHLMRGKGKLRSAMADWRKKG